MRSKIRIFALIVGGALSLAGVSPANAVPINYSFSVTATEGPLSGVTENGTFSYDSSSVVPGGGSNNATGLLTALDLTWNGITYNQTTANTGSLIFDATGNLAAAILGNNCNAGGCGASTSTNDWYAVLGFGEFTYATPETESLFSGTSTFALAPTTIPEPASLTLLGAALVGFRWFGRRRQPAGISPPRV